MTPYVISAVTDVYTDFFTLFQTLCKSLGFPIE